MDCLSELVPSFRAYPDSPPYPPPPPTHTLPAIYLCFLFMFIPRIYLLCTHIHAQNPVFCTFYACSFEECICHTHTYMHKILRILHFVTSQHFLFSDYSIVPCYLDCEETRGDLRPPGHSHYHCPFCGHTHRGMDRFTSHLAACSRGDNSQQGSGLIFQKDGTDSVVRSEKNTSQFDRDPSSDKNGM